MHRDAAAARLVERLDAFAHGGRWTARLILLARAELSGGNDTTASPPTAIDKLITAWPEHCRIITTGSGLLAIGSSFCGLGFLDWISDESNRQIEAEREAFMDAVALGFAKQMAYLSSDEMKAACQIAATRHSEGAVNA